MMEEKKLAAKYQVIESQSLIQKLYIIFLIPGVWIHQLQLARGICHLSLTP